MPNVTLRLQLHRFDTMEDATKVADDIRTAGEVNYTDATGSTVNVTVGDVTVEGDASKS
jgi:hypothetical protein